MKSKKITLIIHRLRRKWRNKGFSPIAINTGHCDLFAEELEQNYPLGKAIWGDDHHKLFRTKVDHEGHCFFALQGRYYDSECPKGVTSPDKLPFYQRANQNGEFNYRKYYKSA